MLTQPFWRGAVGQEAAVPLSGTGTVLIEGDLSADLTVAGDLVVTGEISGNAVASGTIAFGSLTGTAVEGARISSCDLQADDGTLTFRRSVTSDSDGSLSTVGSVDDDAAAVVFRGTWRCRADDSDHAFFNDGGDVTIAEGASCEFDSLGGLDWGRGHSVRNAGTITVRGELKTSGDLSMEGDNYNIYNEGTIVVKGGGSVVLGEGGMDSSSEVYGIGNIGSDSRFEVEPSGKVSGEANRQCVRNFGAFVVGGVVSVSAMSALSSGDCAAICNCGPDGKFEISAGGSATASGGNYGVWNNTNGAEFAVEEGGALDASGKTAGIYCSVQGTEMRVSGSATATGGDYGVHLYADGATFRVTSSGSLTASGGVWSVYVQSGSYSAEEGASTTYDGPTFGV